MRNTAIIFVFIFLLSSGCHPGNKGRDLLHPVIATLRGPSGMGMIRLFEKDSLRHMDVDPTVLLLDEPLQVRALMLKEEVDFAVLPTSMAALLYARGVAYRLAAIPVWGTLYLVGDTSLQGSWKTLRGQRIYMMGRGMTPDILFRFLATKNGIDPDRDLLLDYSFPTHLELANAIAAGKARAGVISEPMVSVILQKNPSTGILLDLNEEWTRSTGGHTPMAQTALMVRNAYASENPEAVKEILEEWQRSTQWVNEHPAEAGKLIARYGILADTSLAAISIHRAHLRFASADSLKKDILQFLTVFYNFDPLTIGGKLPDEAFFYKK
jgi:NitT/TauT family transport system substrate-binding protein